MSERRARPASKNPMKSVWRRALTPPQPPKPPAPAPPARSAAADSAEVASVVESALYQDGVRVSSPATLAETFRELRDQPSGMAWIGLARPTEAELLSLAAEFDLHPLAVEDAMEAHQRPKLERYGDTLFVVLRAARYRDDPRRSTSASCTCSSAPTSCSRSGMAQPPDLAVVRRRMEDDAGPAAARPEAVLYAMLDAVVDGYAPVVVPACRTTSTRSRPRSSAAIPSAPGASTNSPAKWSSSNAPPAPWSGCSTALSPASPNTARRGTAALPTRRGRPRHPHLRSASTASARHAHRHPHRQRHPGHTAQNEEMRAWRRQHTRRTRRSRRSRRGRRSCSRRR